MAAEMKFGDYIKGGVDIFKANLVPSIVAGACAMIIPVFGLQVMVNYLKAVKEAKNGGKAIEIGALFDMANVVPNIIGMFIAGIFAMCCGLPFGLVFFTPCLLADHPGIGFMEAVKGGLAFGKRNAVPSIILMLVLGVVAGLGSIVVIGGFITFPIALCAHWLAYEDHKAAIHAAAAEDGIVIT